jgi:hypothetical protein
VKVLNPPLKGTNGGNSATVSNDYDGPIPAVNAGQRFCMNAIPPFDALHWIGTNIDGGPRLSPETFDAVSGFTVMWNLFEQVVCDNRATVPGLQRVAQRVGRRAPLPEIEASLEFWTARYLTGSEFNRSFDSLHFRERDRREEVEAVLRGEKNDAESRMLAILIIIYRLRNNLFHGLKQISTLNSQIANLNMACHSLAAILAVARPDLIARDHGGLAPARLFP